MTNNQLPDIIDPQARERLEQFAALLLEWNRVHNLTGARSASAIWEQIEDSLYPLTFLPTFRSLLDIGTGAGFPGLVLAIARPEAETTLCEPLQKRAAFLRHAALELGLERVEVAAKRIQALDPRPYELITSRAVTETAHLVAWCRPFIGEGSRLLFYKGERAEEEAEALGACHPRIVTRGRRRYLIIEDTASC
ncbi:16S rRNA (guanine(527)-N(7))-methyltransferase RsmG [Hydrogenimonas sp.]